MGWSISLETDLNQKERKSQSCRFAQCAFNENVKKSLLNFWIKNKLVNRFLGN